MAPYNKSEASNAYVKDKMLASYWVCTGCLYAWANGEIQCLGEYGCNFPVLNDLNRHLFTSRIYPVPGTNQQSQTLECARCMLLNKDCCAVSAWIGSIWAILPHFGPILTVLQTPRGDWIELGPLWSWVQDLKRGSRLLTEDEEGFDPEHDVWKDIDKKETKIIRADIMDHLKNVKALINR
jgi:hypothetical protein